MALQLLQDKTTQVIWKTPTLVLLMAQDGSDYCVLKADPTTRKLEVLTTLQAGSAIVGDVGYKGYTTVKSGQITVTTAGTAVVGTTEAGSLFAIKAHPDNTDVVWVGQDGANDVTKDNGFPLDPGETIVLNMANLNQAYFDADVSGEKVCWIKLA